MMGRRTFVTSTLAASALAAARCASGPSAAGPTPVRAKRRILILGGTGFLGPALVEAARPRGHTLTLFNRGKTNPGMFPDIEQLHGDRDGQLDALRGRSWDAVIDDSGYVPRVVRQSAELLAPSVGQYVFISTISVYSDGKIIGMDERGPREKLPPEDASSEEVKKYYGALKALCEDAVGAVYGARATTVRPGLIVGPRDATDRFTYWPVRFARGGEVLAPGDGTDPIEYIDVRDLAEWIIEHVVEEKVVGVFNAVGPAQKLTMRGLVEGCQHATATPSTVTWVPTAFLEKHEARPWSDLPVWVPASGDEPGFSQISAAAAIARGLRFRSVADTARDTIAWWQTVPAERREKPMKAGLTPERERELLDAFKKGG
jgi:2'-hydroxyisoflavone reductase